MSTPPEATARDQEIAAKYLYPVVEEFRESVEGAQDLAAQLDTPLIGAETVLDSLGLVNFLVAVEERLTTDTNRSIRLVNEKALSRKQSPFRTLGTLAAFIGELLDSPE